MIKGTQILYPDLTPGNRYVVQVRAIGQDGSPGPWSPNLVFTAAQDEIPPSPITNLVFVADGMNFIATWDAPTTNDADGSPELQDLWGYEIHLESPDAGITKVWFQNENFYTLTLADNIAFFGVPRGNLTITVIAIDNNINRSEPVTATAENTPPAAATNVAAEPLPEAIHLSWDASPEEDFMRYEVYMSTDSGFVPDETNLAWQGTDTSTVLITAGDYSTHYIAICVVDAFGIKSDFVTVSGTPMNSFNFDTEPPADVTGLHLISGVLDSDGTSTATLGWDQNLADDLAGYTIQYQRSGDNSTYYYEVVDPTATEVSIPGLLVDHQYAFTIVARDTLGNRSTPPASITYSINDMSAAIPNAPTGLTLGAGNKSLFVLWNPYSGTNVVPDGSGSFTVQLDEVNTFDSGSLQTKTGLKTPFASFYGLTNDTTYFVRVQAVNAKNQPGPWTATSSATPSPNLDPNSISGEVIMAGTLAGDRIVANSITGDEIAANSVGAEVLRANTAFTNDLHVASVFTMDVAGQMKSSDYVAGTTGWSLTTALLEINQGTIHGETIKAGAIASQQTVTYDGVTRPKWSINTNGGAVFADALVLGHLLVGDGTGTPGNQFVSSYNYVAGSTGWAIKGDGSVEFNSGVFRGTVNFANTSGSTPNLTGGTISGTSTISGLINIGNTGSAHVEIGTNVFGESGIRLYNSSLVKLVDLNSNGTASFVGTVQTSGLTGIAKVMLNAATNRMEIYTGWPGETAPGLVYVGPTNVWPGPTAALGSPNIGYGQSVIAAMAATSSLPAQVVTTAPISIMQQGGVTDVTLTSVFNPLQIGSLTGTNMVMDNNEIQVRNNYNPAGLYFNLYGGDIAMGKAGYSTTFHGAVVVEYGLYLSSAIVGNGQQITNVVINSATINTPNINSGGSWTGSPTIGGTLNMSTGSIQFGLGNLGNGGSGAVYMGLNTAGTVVKGSTTGINASRREVKQEIQDAPIDYRILDLRPRTFKYKTDVKDLGDDAPTHVGLIAEEVEEKGLIPMVSYLNGKIDSLWYDQIGVYLIPIVRELREEVADLKAELAKLTA